MCVKHEVRVKKVKYDLYTVIDKIFGTYLWNIAVLLYIVYSIVFIINGLCVYITFFFSLLFLHLTFLLQRHNFASLMTCFLVRGQDKLSLT